MNKTDFAELKEKLADMSDDFDYKKHIDKYYSENSIPHKLYKNKIKSAAIISELVDIIKNQSEALDEIYSFEKHCPDTHYFMVLNKSLSETTTRLQKLRDGIESGK